MLCALLYFRETLSGDLLDRILSLENGTSSISTTKTQSHTNSAVKQELSDRKSSESSSDARMSKSVNLSPKSKSIGEMNTNTANSRESHSEEFATLHRQLEIVTKERDQWKTDYHHLANILIDCRKYTANVNIQQEIKEPAVQNDVALEPGGTAQDVTQESQRKIQNTSNSAIPKKRSSVYDYDGEADCDPAVDLDLVFESSEPTRRSSRDRSTRPVYTENHSNEEWWLWW